MEKRLFKIPVFAVLLAVFLLGAGKEGLAGQQSMPNYKGGNIEAQNYSQYGSPITSYLLKCVDGRLVRVQSGASAQGILAEYYDSSYQWLSSRIIPKELPVFGGFYETSNYYFILTGQSNDGESDAKEVFRITKYDKDWKRIASAGLKACNTTEPFASGSARMAVSGKYLFVHTCHLMYASSDGRNHQANVTIQLDMENMKIEDFYTQVGNVANDGYVSHSFNQFIQIEENHVVTVDQGDGYPRSAVLFKNSADASSEKFTGGSYTALGFLDFQGNTGTNATGASLGGFEISDSSYLLAGNSVVQDTKNLQRKTRNIFVSVADKKAEGEIQIVVNAVKQEIIAAIRQPENAVSLKWITNYAEGTETTSTPHLVKISPNAYLLLWSRAGKVYYVPLDGKGEKTDKVYALNGSLSDCVPLVTGGKLVWYTWKNNAVTFYEISLNDLSKSRTAERTDDKSKSRAAERTDRKSFSVSGAGYKVIGSNTVDYVKPPAIKTVKIPATVKNGNKTYKVTGIAAKAFQNNKKVTNVTIGSRVITIGKSAFAGCKNLKKVTIGKSVKTIQDKAFFGNRKLKNITVKTKKLTKKSIGKKAFQKLHAKAVIQVPAKKRAAYRKLLKASGFSGKCK